MKVNIKTNNINKIYRDKIFKPGVYTWENLLFGGSSSGKSYFMFTQFMIVALLMGGRNFLVLRKVQRTNKDTTYPQVLKGLEKLGALKDEFIVNKSEMFIEAPNGYRVFFRGLDDTAKLKGLATKKSVITDVVMEEVSEITENDMKEVKKRIRGKTDKHKRFFYLTNPVDQNHWLYKNICAPKGFRIEDKFFQDNDTTILHTTYQDNLAHLSEEEVKDLENENVQYYYDVYTLGKWGVLGDLIFTNWETADINNLDVEFSGFYHGLDFGWTAPSAYVKVAVENDAIYIVDAIYKKYAKYDYLVKKIKHKLQDDYLYCDSAEPRSVKMLNEMGIKKAVGAKKPQNHKLTAIRWLQGKRIIIDKSLIEVRNEFAKYQWQKDKNGESLEMPIKKNDHAIDALVYSLEPILHNTNAGINTIWR